MRTLIIILTIQASAFGACTYKSVCSYGTCSMQQVCTSTWDRPSMQIKPREKMGFAPRVPRVRSLTPPIGTTSCTPSYVDGDFSQVCR